MFGRGDAINKKLQRGRKKWNAGVLSEEEYLKELERQKVEQRKKKEDEEKREKEEILKHYKNNLIGVSNNKKGQSDTYFEDEEEAELYKDPEPPSGVSTLRDEVFGGKSGKDDIFSSKEAYSFNRHRPRRMEQLSSNKLSQEEQSKNVSKPLSKREEAYEKKRRLKMQGKKQGLFDEDDENPTKGVEEKESLFGNDNSSNSRISNSKISKRDLVYEQKRMKALGNNVSNRVTEDYEPEEDIPSYSSHINPKRVTYNNFSNNQIEEQPYTTEQNYYEPPVYSNNPYSNNNNLLSPSNKLPSNVNNNKGLKGSRDYDFASKGGSFLDKLGGQDPPQPRPRGRIMQGSNEIQNSNVNPNNNLYNSPNQSSVHSRNERNVASRNPSIDSQFNSAYDNVSVYSNRNDNGDQRYAKPTSFKREITGNGEDPYKKHQKQLQLRMQLDQEINEKKRREEEEKLRREGDRSKFDSKRINNTSVELSPQKVVSPSSPNELSTPTKNYFQSQINLANDNQSNGQPIVGMRGALKFSEPTQLEQKMQEKEKKLRLQRELAEQMEQQKEEKRRKQMLEEEAEKKRQKQIEEAVEKERLEVEMERKKMEEKNKAAELKKEAVMTPLIKQPEVKTELKTEPPKVVEEEKKEIEQPKESNIQINEDIKNDLFGSEPKVIRSTRKSNNSEKLEEKAIQEKSTVNETVLKNLPEVSGIVEALKEMKQASNDIKTVNIDKQVISYLLSRLQESKDTERKAKQETPRLKQDDMTMSVTVSLDSESTFIYPYESEDEEVIPVKRNIVKPMAVQPKIVSTPKKKNPIIPAMGSKGKKDPPNRKGISKRVFVLPTPAGDESDGDRELDPSSDEEYTHLDVDNEPLEEKSLPSRSTFLKKRRGKIKE